MPNLDLELCYFTLMDIQSVFKRQSGMKHRKERKERKERKTTWFYSNKTHKKLFIQLLLF